MARQLMGTKRGMVQVYDKEGNPLVCTLLHVEPNVITQIKTLEKDKYEAIQLGYSEVKVRDPRTMEKRVAKPLIGHFKKANVQPRRFLYEVRVVDSSTFQVGQKMDLQLFEGVSHIDVTGQSKGKGYQGVIKKHGFSGGPASHGSGFHRHAGSTGMRSSPGRCLPGGPRPSHMGDEQVTVQNLRVISIDLASNVMLVEGAVPGGKNGIVVLSDAVKKTK
jgi:large subunit ribosomal protein L3